MPTGRAISHSATSELVTCRAHQGDLAGALKSYRDSLAISRETCQSKIQAMLAGSGISLVSYT